MDSRKKKTLFIIIGIIAVVAIVVAIVVALFLTSRKDSFEYEGWIDCQPILSEKEAELCERAEAAGYPYIAY